MKRIVQFFKFIVIDILGRILATNWSKRIILKDNQLELLLYIYESHCWFCQHNIKAIQDYQNEPLKYQLYKMTARIRWTGATKCPKQGCHYFLCPVCKKCLCNPDAPPIHKRNQQIVTTKWIETPRRNELFKILLKNGYVNHYSKTNLRSFKKGNKIITIPFFKEDITSSLFIDKLKQADISIEEEMNSI